MSYFQAFFCIFLFSSSVYAGVALPEEFEKKGLPPVNHQDAFLKEQLEKDCQKFKYSAPGSQGLKIPYVLREEAETIFGSALPSEIEFGEIDSLQQTLQLRSCTLSSKELLLYKKALDFVVLNFDNFFSRPQRPTRSNKTKSFEWSKIYQDYFHSVCPQLLLEVAYAIPYRGDDLGKHLYPMCIDKIKSIVSHHKNLFTKSQKEKEEIINDELERIFSYEYFGFKDESAKREYLTKEPFGFLESNHIEELYNSTQKLLNLSHQRDTFVFFGNTPYWLGHAFEAVLQANPEQHRFIISFPFSGSPNRGRAGQQLHIDDCTTPQRVSHLMDFLAQKGLSPDNPKLEEGNIYFVDNVFSGTGPAFVIEELIRSFQQKGKKIPNISLVALNGLKSYLTKHDYPGDDERPATIYKGEDKVCLPSINNPHFTMDLIELEMKSASLSLDLVKGVERFYPFYPASMWRPEYDFLHDLEHSTYMRYFAESFDFHIAQHIEADGRHLTLGN